MKYKEKYTKFVVTTMSWYKAYKFMFNLMLFILALLKFV